MSSPIKVTFLHIPKTAGQSVHAALVHAFSDENVCPARSNKFLVQMSIAEINRYRVFSGHLDWSLLDCVRGEKYVFTILRQPMERILSFYFYLRKDAEKFSPSELEEPERRGMKAALELSPHEYFTSGPQNIRNFLNEHYDNFYTYYFAGRHFKGRSALHGHLKSGALSQEKLVDLAIENMMELNDVFTVGGLSEVFEAIQALSGTKLADESQYKKNVNTETKPAERLERLMALGATKATIARIQQFCEMDDELWRRFSEKRA